MTLRAARSKAKYEFFVHLAFSERLNGDSTDHCLELDRFLGEGPLAACFPVASRNDGAPIQTSSFVGC